MGSNKERPIIFSGESVQAILAGKKTQTMKELPITMTTESVRSILSCTKTQTRRVIIPQPEQSKTEPEWFSMPDKKYMTAQYEAKSLIEFFCPYKIRQKRWVREIWSAPGYENKKPSEIPRDAKIYYKSIITQEKEPLINRWRSPRFMCKWMAQVWIEIIDVGMERLQDISLQDAMLEVGQYHISEVDDPAVGDPIGIFSKRWNFINAKRGYSWESNPLVWTIRFVMQHEPKCKGLY